MASLNVFFPAATPIVASPARRRTTSFKTFATAAKSSGRGGSSEEKSFLDFILGSLTKEDQFYETDPILKKVDDGNKSSGTTTTTSKKAGSVSSQPKKKEGGGGGGGGFAGLGGLFAKK